jgi:uncharacterized RDD family membrane protein YckC
MSQWYYGDAQGHRHGPMTAAQLAAAHAQGKLAPQTLVWREGLADWKPWQEMMHEVVVPPLSPPPAAPSPAAGAVPTAQAATAAPRSVFDAEPAIDASHVVYAGFWKRVAASLIDACILMLASWIVQMPLFLILGAGLGSMVDGSGFSDEYAMVLVGIGYLISFAVPLFYFAWMHASSLQASIGKLAIGIKVVDGRGARIGFWRAFARYFAYLLSGLLLGVGHLLAAFTDRKRALQDMLCDTLVVDRHAYSARPDLQNPNLGTVTIVVLVLAGLILVVSVIGVIAIIAALGSGGWH